MSLSKEALLVQHPEGLDALGHNILAAFGVEAHDRVNGGPIKKFFAGVGQFLFPAMAKQAIKADNLAALEEMGHRVDQEPFPPDPLRSYDVGFILDLLSWGALFGLKAIAHMSPEGVFLVKLGCNFAINTLGGSGINYRKILAREALKKLER